MLSNRTLEVSANYDAGVLFKFETAWYRAKDASGQTLSIWTSRGATPTQKGPLCAFAVLCGLRVKGRAAVDETINDLRE